MSIVDKASALWADKNSRTRPQLNPALDIFIAKNNGAAYINYALARIRSALA